MEKGEGEDELELEGSKGVLVEGEGAGVGVVPPPFLYNAWVDYSWFLKTWGSRVGGGGEDVEQVGGREEEDHQEN